MPFSIERNVGLCSPWIQAAVSKTETIANGSNQRQHAGDRQIYPATDDHQRKAASQDPEYGCLPQRVAVGSDLKKRAIRVENATDGDDKSQRRQCARRGNAPQPR